MYITFRRNVTMTFCFSSVESNSEILVTASHAVFHNEGGKTAPAAVVGFQFQHSALYKLFHNITGNVGKAPDL